MFSFGIEHEVAFLNQTGQFADFSCTTFRDFQQIIDRLPFYDGDEKHLRLGDAGIKKKRWYIEGFERFADSPQTIDCAVKGIEIRTTIHSTIGSVIDELTTSFELLKQTAAEFGFTPFLVSFNPRLKRFQPEPPLNAYEIEQARAYPDDHAEIYMVSYGPDLNLSVSDFSINQLIDAGQKLTYYSPYIVPLTYSSPFYGDRLWGGLSVRTFLRTGKRSAVLVFVENEADLIASQPKLTKLARLPAEIGRIEFKAFDTCGDFKIYAGLLALLKGLILDQTLPGRAIVPDPELHQLSAQWGFDRPEILNSAQAVIQAAELALADDPDRLWLAPLHDIFAQHKTTSHQLIEMFHDYGSMAALFQALKATPSTQDS